MKINEKVIVVTGGASGIGLALCKRFIAEGASVALSDLNAAAADEKAKEIGAFSIAANVGKEEDIANLVKLAIEKFGRIDMFVSNAGIAFPGDENTPAEKWKLIYDVNVLAHVYAAKYVLPQMLERGEGYLLNVASAAGLLVEFNTAPYTATKHAAVGFAEWLALTYADRGIKVSVLCPAAVRTPMTANSPSLQQNSMEPEELVEITMRAIEEERFLISTHQYVSDLFKLKGDDYEKYLDAMRQYRNASAQATKNKT